MRLLINIRKEEIGNGLDEVCHDFSDWFAERSFHYQIFEKQITRDLHTTLQILKQKKLKELFGIINN